MPLHQRHDDRRSTPPTKTPERYITCIRSFTAIEQLPQFLYRRCFVTCRSFEKSGRQYGDLQLSFS